MKPNFRNSTDNGHDALRFVENSEGTGVILGRKETVHNALLWVQQMPAYLEWKQSNNRPNSQPVPETYEQPRPAAVQAQAPQPQQVSSNETTVPSDNPLFAESSTNPPADRTNQFPVTSSETITNQVPLSEDDDRVARLAAARENVAGATEGVSERIDPETYYGKAA